jgi:hypothetical protein
MKLIERFGYIDKDVLYSQLISDFVDSGFELVWVNNGAITDLPGSIVATKAVLNATTVVDPLANTQPWRICIDGTVSGGQLVAATHLQIKDDGQLATFPNGVLIPANSTAINKDICGLIGHANTGDVGVTPDTFISPATPYSYRLCVANRGFSVEFWQGVSVLTPVPERPYPVPLADGVPFDPIITFPTSRNFSWVCVQRLVDPISGETYVKNNSPVVALYSMDSTKTAWKIIVRESQIIAPTLSWITSKYTEYNGQVINIEKQIVLTDTSKYYIIFPSGFNTHRHLYNEEMDLIAYTSAGVLASGNDAVVNVYKQGTIKFTGGSIAPLLGDVITGSNGARAIILKIVLESGDWTTSDAAGTFFVHSLEGQFETLTTIANNLDVTISVVGTVSSQLTYRTYRGGNANINDSEGVRCLILSDDGGIA